MRNFGLMMLATALLASCANDKNGNVVDAGQLVGLTYDSRMSATARVDSSNNSVRFDEPRFNNNGTFMKLWAYGPIFATLETNSFSDHMNSACALLAGPNSRYETHMDSAFVPFGEFGLVLDGTFGAQVAVRQVGRFGDYDYPYWRAENSKYVQSITCGNAQTFPNNGRNNFPHRNPNRFPRR